MRRHARAAAALDRGAARVRADHREPAQRVAARAAARRPRSAAARSPRSRRAARARGARGGRSPARARPRPRSSSAPVRASRRSRRRTISSSTASGTSPRRTAAASSAPKWRGGPGISRSSPLFARRHAVLRAEPVRDHDAVEAPLVAQDPVQQRCMRGAGRPVQAVVGGHQRPRAGLAHRRLEGRQVELAQRARIDLATRSSCARTRSRSRRSASRRRRRPGSGRRARRPRRCARRAAGPRSSPRSGARRAASGACSRSGASSTWAPLLRASSPSAAPSASTSSGFQVRRERAPAREAGGRGAAAEVAAARAVRAVAHAQRGDAETRHRVTRPERRAGAEPRLLVERQLRQQGLAPRVVGRHGPRGSRSRSPAAQPGRIGRIRWINVIADGAALADAAGHAAHPGAGLSRLPAARRLGPVGGIRAHDALPARARSARRLHARARRVAARQPAARRRASSWPCSARRASCAAPSTR